MHWRHSAYGLCLIANRCIPGFAPGAEADQPDVGIEFGDLPHDPRTVERVVWYEGSESTRTGKPNLVISRLPDSAFHFAYDDRTHFVIDAKGTKVWCSMSGGTTIADASVYLRGPILGFVLRLRDVVSLHASAVAAGSSAIAILAASGGGKSTTAAEFVRLGLKVISDDVVALRRRATEFGVSPGCPRLNLWPDSAEALYGDSESLPRLIPRGGSNDWWDKRFADLQPGWDFQESELPLAAIYALSDRSADAVRTSIESMSAQDAFVWLTDCTYVNYALDGKMRATEFELLADLVRNVPIRLVTPRDDRHAVRELCDAILTDFGQLNTPSGQLVQHS